MHKKYTDGRRFSWRKSDCCSLAKSSIRRRAAIYPSVRFRYRISLLQVWKSGPICWYTAVARRHAAASRSLREGRGGEGPFHFRRSGSQPSFVQVSALAGMRCSAARNISMQLTRAGNTLKRAQASPGEVARGFLPRQKSFEGIIG